MQPLKQYIGFAKLFFTSQNMLRLCGTRVNVISVSPMIEATALSAPICTKLTR
jgi:hypothetical protein